MKRNKMYIKALSVAMICSLGLNMGGISAYGYTDNISYEADKNNEKNAINKILVIENEEDFIKFINNCVNDQYSVNLTVMLKRDINLKGYKASPVPIFNGIFNGNGHKISGFSYTDIGMNIGLFRYVTEKALIKNLNVEVNINPIGDEENVGGIAGENRGRIENCNVSGSIDAKKNVGGVAGVNEKTGVIANCSNGAKMYGDNYTGGISGDNKGTIFNCYNIGEINTKPSDNAEGYGGITGHSEGNIHNCTNRGEIGYKRTGYNVGGIIGINEGDVYKCSNEGNVNAKRNVGGIAGQNLPVAVTEYHSKVDDLKDALEGTGDLLKDANNNINTLVDTVTDLMDEITNTLDNISDITTVNVDEIKNALDEADAKINQNVEDIKGLVDDATDEADNANDGVRRVTHNMAGAIKDFEKVPFNKLHEDTEKTNAALRDFLSKISIKNAGINVSVPSDITDLVTNVAVENPIAFGDGAAAAFTNFINCYQQMSKTATQVATELKKVKEDLVIVADAIDKLDQSYAALKEVSNDIDIIANEIDDTSDILHKFIELSSDDIQKIIDSTNDYVDTMNNNVDGMYNRIDLTTDRITSDFDNVIDKVSAASDILIDLFNGTSETENDISEDVEIGLGSAIIGCSNSGSVSADNNAGGIAGIAAKDNVRDVNEIGEKVENLVKGTYTYEDVIKDVTENSDENIDLDKSIAATVTDHVLSDVFTTYRMHISSCSNSGDITVRENYAGGIAGYGLDGAVMYCNNLGLITTQGEYCGGIMGYSEGNIRNCNSAGTLVSDGKAGGIVGYGNNIYDCNSMVAIESDSIAVGSIAYYATGTVAGNRFVSDVLSGVDGINKKGEAIRVDYDEVKDIFKTMVVTFIGEDNQIIAKMNVEYGKGIDELPVVMNRDKEYWVWDDFDKNRIVTNMFIHGEYQSRLSTLAIDNGLKMPDYLVDGDFYPGQELVLDNNVSLNHDFGELKVYDYGKTYVTAYNGNEYNKRIRMRVKNTAENVDVYSMIDDSLQKITSYRDGSYIVFNIENGGTFVIVERKLSIMPIVIAVIVGIIVMISIIVAIVAKNKKKQSSTVEVDNEKKDQGKGKGSKEHKAN